MTDRVKEILGRLQERHVPRTAVLYLGAGWVALEFIGFVVDNYAVDRVLLDVSLLLIGIGFPIALIISWYHGIGGRQTMTRAESVLIGTLLLAGVSGAMWIVTRERPEPRAPALAPAGVYPVDLGEGSLAVLPLANHSGADSLDWLGPGLADMLTTNLAQFHDLRVVSAQRLLDLLRQAGRGETERIPEDLALRVAAESGARSLVRGSFVAVGGDVRLDVQLIDLEDGTVTAAEQARGSDVFALVDDVSARLSGQLLGRAFTPTELTPVAQLATGNLDAYREYQEGVLAERRFLNEQAEAHYRRAVALDPTFAIAWLRLGMLSNTAQTAILAFQNADRYKDEASERDRYMIEAMFAARLANDFEQADSLLRALIASYPEEKDARYQLGVFYDGQGRADEAREVIEEAVRLDPYFAPGVNHLAYLAGRRGDSVGADTLSLRYLTLEVGQANPHDSRGEILEMIGRRDDARAEFRAALQIEPGFLASYEHLVRSYLREDDSDGARDALRAYANVGDPEGSVWVRWLEGDTYVAEGRYREGLGAYGRAAIRAADADLDEFRLAALLESARLASAIGAFEEADRAYRAADAIDSLNQGVFFGLVALYGQQGRFDEMTEVRDSAAARFASAPEFIRDRVGLLTAFAEGIMAYHRGDPESAVARFDEARELAGVPRPAATPGLAEEALALIETGRAGEALGLTENMERVSTTGNRFVPFPVQVAYYLRGRAYEALDDTLRASESYGRLLELAGDGVRETTFMDDAPDRLAALRDRAGTTPTGESASD